MQINYLLKRFPKTEWSGPAWYKLKEDIWNLVYFKPIDLGSHSATEFEGDDLLKVMKEVQSKVPITGCHQGIIHSHHGMGAFHSGTDDKELEDGANRVGYPSLVVAHTGAPFAFKYSYEDQFGNIHLEKGKVKVEHAEYKPHKEWIEEADKIEKEAKSKAPSYVTYNRHQGNLWGGSSQNVARYDGWGALINQDEVEYNTEYEKCRMLKSYTKKVKCLRKSMKNVKRNGKNMNQTILELYNA